MTGLTGNNAITGAGYRKNQPPYEIDQSLRVDDGDSANLSRTPSSASNRKTWTWSGWVKRGNLATGSNQCFFSAGVDGSNFQNLAFNTSDALFFDHYESNVLKGGRTSTAVYRDTSAWYHIVVAYDTTQSTASDRIKIYVNGEVVSDFSSTTDPALNHDGIVNNTVEHRHFSIGYGAYWLFDGYLAEVNFIDGQALTPASFGDTLASTNQWVPIEYEGSYGTNGFYLPFSNTELANSFTSDSTTSVIDAYTSGSGNWTCPAGVTSVEVLVVAGGGGGGGLGGGGGAGGVVHQSSRTVVPGNTYAYSVGTGGVGRAYGFGLWGGTGGNSTFDTITAVGGGGGSGTGYNGGAGRDGGSGGGGNGGYASPGGSGTQADSGGGTGYGNDGGDGVGGNYYGGGGGGADTAGGNGNSPSGKTGAGGSGKLFSTFTAYGTTSGNVASSGSNGGYFGGGGAGGGGSGTTAGDAGVGGGGAGGTDSTSANGSDAIANTGGGGGGAGNGTGGDGASGIVLIKYTGTHTITANGDVTNSRAQKKIGSSSIYFDQTDSLSCADNADFDFGAGQFTVECWAYFQGSSLSSGVDIITKYDDAGTNQRSWGIKYPAANNLEFRYSTNGSSWAQELTFSWTPSLNTWYHIAVSRDGSGDIRAFIDGTQIGSTQNVTATFYNSTALLVMGADMYNGSIHYGNALDGYMDEIRISNTARYTSNFTPSTTAFSSDANTKLLIHSDFDGGLGADYSGNTNDFSATNLVATDQVLDSPTNNFCTFNPLGISTYNKWNTASEGNLKLYGTGDNFGESTFHLSSGKWYFEVDLINSYGKDGTYITLAGPNDTYLSGSFDVRLLNGLGTGDNPGLYGVAVDMDTGSWSTTRNGSAFGSGSFTPQDCKIGICNGNGAFAEEIVLNFGQDSSFAGNRTAQGNTDGNGIGDFYYTPPSGYFALCSDNLSDPSIADPTAHFDTTLVSGNGSNRSITGLNFQPDFLWGKSRTNTLDHYLTDSVRGVTKQLYSNRYIAENSETVIYTAFNSDGFSLGTGDMNLSGQNYAHWAWKGGGSASNNNEGSITSSVSANTTAGFSIVGWAGTGSNVTVGHGLSQAPELIINKSRTLNNSSSQWAVQSILWNSASDTNMLYLNGTGAASDDTNVFQAAPTSTVFSPQGGGWAGIGASGEDYIAYCFHSVEGYSKIGKYTGNSNADGPMFYCGFKPSWAMFKATDSAQSWTVFDNKRNVYNLMDNSLFPDLNNVENDATSLSIDFVSNGIKIRSAHNYVNYSGSDYLVLAFAESPFKYSRGR